METTLWCGNLAPEVDEELLLELFLQAGPLERVAIPKERNGCSKGYGFVVFKHDYSVLYAIELMKAITLFGRKIVTQPRINPGEKSLNHQRRASLQDHRIHYHPSMTANANRFQGSNIPVLGAQVPYTGNQSHAHVMMGAPMFYNMIPQSDPPNHRRWTHHGSFLYNYNCFDSRGCSSNIVPFNAEDELNSRNNEEHTEPTIKDANCVSSDTQDRSFVTLYDRRRRSRK